MRKKSFWLCLNPRDPPPRREGRRPPLRLCTRRPVSSEAPGLRVQRGHGARVRDRRAGHPPRRRSPSSSVSSSSSSFLPSCGFPRSFSGRFSGPGFGSRTVFSGPPGGNPSSEFKSVKNRVRPEFGSGAVSYGPPGPVSVRPPAPLPQSSRSVRPAGPAAVRGSGLPPGSGLLFRSFAVHFVHGSYLSSFCVRFSSFACLAFSLSLLGPVPFVPACFRSFFRSVRSCSAFLFV